MPIVWQVSILHLHKRTLLDGVLLMDRPYTHDGEINFFQNFIEVARSYFIKTYTHRDITISVGDEILNSRTNGSGSFSIEAEGHLDGNIVIKARGSGKPLQIIQNYPTIFPNTSSSFDVISDIDDTIIVSHTASFFKRIKTLAFVAPKKRKSIAFTTNLFEQFKVENARVVYVSKSERNLFSVITSFIEFNNLPKGKLILSPYLTFGQLLLAKKGSNYKINNIRYIIENSLNKKFLLIGDDSQRDIEIYTAIAKEFPDRILKIYIRQTNRIIRARQKKMFKKLKETNLPVLYFNTSTKFDEIKEINQKIN